MTRAALEEARKAAAAATVEGIKKAAATKAQNRADFGGDEGIFGGQGKMPKWNLPPAQPPMSKRLTPDFMRVQTNPIYFHFTPLNLGHSPRWLRIDPLPTDLVTF
jgi:hypothetical protein